MKYVGLICARGGSRGCPRKNVADLGGQPLIAHAVRHALAQDRIERVIVSTDDAEIAERAVEAGAEVPFMRPAELAGDRAAEWLVWQHALQWVRDDIGAYPEAMVSLPTTAPMRSAQDISACLDLYEQGAFDVVLTVSEAHRSPWFNMVTIDDGGAARLVNAPEGQVFRRQDAPAVWDVTTVCYVVRTSFVMSAERLFEGRVGAVQVPVERAIDIDTPLDLEIARFLWQRQHGEQG